MGKAYKINKNNTVSIIPHVNYMYGVSTKRFNRIITTTRMPDYFTYLGGTHTSSGRAHCAFCVFDGVLYTTFGTSNGRLHADNLGDGTTRNDDSDMDDGAAIPTTVAKADCSGLVIKDGNPYFVIRHGSSKAYALFF